MKSSYLFTCLILLCLLYTPLSGQNKSLSDTCNYITLEAYKEQLPEIINLYKVGKHIKTSDSVLEKAFWIALSFYPELKETRLTFKLRRIPATMSALPATFYFLYNQPNRKYSVNVNNRKERFGMDYTDLTFNALVGWIGHELAHIEYYQNTSTCKLTGFVIKYAFCAKYRRETERNTDISAIRHNLGNQLLEGCEFLLSNPNVKGKYKKRHRNFYLSPEEIKDMLNPN